ncbi:MAG: aspartate kinase [Bacteroidales bacterium]|nr:aspartate kinase [Bacteroidales bacterium]
MKVFKFGGASVKDAPAIENLKNILQRYENEQLVVVISAMGKTTNFLEKLLDAYYHAQENVPVLLAELRTNHETVAAQLMGTENPFQPQSERLFTLLNEQLQRPTSDNFDYDYDRVVSFGELLSTTLISTYLNTQGVETQWLDARQLIRTDNTYREGHVDWTVTQKLAGNTIKPYFQNRAHGIVLTQGFIAGTAENQTTTLGREGSDYSAAILAHTLDADSVTVWKDVPGILNADPKRFPNAVKIDTLTYHETVELAYYGASVIHPKTLRPLHNKQIPLFVKSFFHPENEGSKITQQADTVEIPSYIVKDNQLLLSVSPRDFSIIGVENLSKILDVLSEYRVKINLIQNSALTFSVCTDNVPLRLQPCIEALGKEFVVKFNEDIRLVTIRHYDSESEKEILKMFDKEEVIIRQNNRHTIQLVLKQIN